MPVRVFSRIVIIFGKFGNAVPVRVLSRIVTTFGKFGNAVPVRVFGVGRPLDLEAREKSQNA